VTLYSKFINASGEPNAIVFRRPGELRLKPVSGWDNYPVLPDPVVTDAQTLFCCDYKDFQAAVDFCSPCMSTENSRRYLGGIAFDRGNKCMVATDGRRLAQHDFELSGEGVPIVPAEALRFIKRLGFKDGSIDAKINPSVIAGGKICFHFQDFVIVSDLIDGTFPNWKQVVPAAEGRQTWSFKASDPLVKAIKNLSGLKYNKGTIPGIQIEGRGTDLVISDGGNRGFRNEWGEFSHKTTKPEAGDFCFTMDTTFFLEAVAVMGPEISCGYDPEHPLAAVTFRDAGSRQVIIMPMKSYDK
jgi:DNA polymerase-3 subunit beta